jgi:hypothetical protein
MVANRLPPAPNTIHDQDRRGCGSRNTLHRSPLSAASPLRAAVKPILGWQPVAPGGPEHRTAPHPGSLFQTLPTTISTIALRRRAYNPATENVVRHPRSVRAPIPSVRLSHFSKKLLALFHGYLPICPSARRWCSEISEDAVGLSALLGYAMRTESGRSASIMRLRTATPMAGSACWFAIVSAVRHDSPDRPAGLVQQRADLRGVALASGCQCGGDDGVGRRIDRQILPLQRPFSGAWFGWRPDRRRV